MALPSNASVFLFHPKPPYTNHTLPLVRPVNSAVGRALPLISAKHKHRSTYNQGRASPVDVDLGHALRSRCRGRLASARAAEKIMGVIVVVCAVFGLHRIGGQD